MDIKKNTKLVNGPINAVRLEGEINGIKKVLHIFMDFHLDEPYQNECENIRATEFRDYIVQSFDKKKDSKKTYDFFFEIMPTKIQEFKDYPFKGKYIKQITKIFSKAFVDKKMFPNINFHYIDIRDYLGRDIDYFIFTDISHQAGTQFLNVNNLEMFKDSLNLITSKIFSIWKVFYEQQKRGAEEKKPAVPKTAEELSKYTPQDFIEKSTNYLNKIKKRYDHKNVEKIMNNFINKELKEYFSLYLSYSLQINKKLDDYIKYFYPPNKLFYHKDIKKNEVFKFFDTGYGLPYPGTVNRSSDISISFDDIFGLSLDLFVLIMDIYFLRRFIDKDYVTNAAVYTGILHSMTYIYVLVKYFDFKITHYSFLRESIPNVTKKIKSADNVYMINHLFYPNDLYQCIDLSSFPDLFE